MINLKKIAERINNSDELIQFKTKHGESKNKL